MPSHLGAALLTKGYLMAWCGICAMHTTTHDTEHHGNPGGLIVGDIGQIVGSDLPADLVQYRGRAGRVQQVRGDQITLALPGRRGNTDTVTFPRAFVVPQR